MKDHLGSASVVTNASGNVVGEQRYYPFGETRLTTGTIFTDQLFAGQREMTGLGIYHYNARFYSPKLGRFLSADTIVPNPANPQAYNRYSYVYNNPIRYNDPTGHCVGAVYLTACVVLTALAIGLYIYTQIDDTQPIVYGQQPPSGLRKPPSTATVSPTPAPTCQVLAQANCITVTPTPTLTPTYTPTPTYTSTATISDFISSLTPPSMAASTPTSTATGMPTPVSTPTPLHFNLPTYFTPTLTPTNISTQTGSGNSGGNNNSNIGNTTITTGGNNGGLVINSNVIVTLSNLNGGGDSCISRMRC